MPYDFLIGNKSNLSPDPSKKPTNYQESLRTKLTMDPKAMFIASPATAGIGKKEPKYPPINPVYFPSIKIGDQIWMSQDLDITTTYNGIAIPNLYDVPEPGFNTIDITTIQYLENGINHNNDTGMFWVWREFDYRSLGYSRWYPYTVVQNLIRNPPSGWRVPTESDFDQLINYLGGNTTAGGYLKGPDTANKWNPIGYNYISYDFPFNAMPSGLSTLEDAAFLYVFYYPNIPQVQVNASPLQIGDFGGSKVSAFWCATNDNTNAASLYYIDWRYNNFFKTTFADYFAKSSSDSNLSVMPIRLIRDF